MHWKIWLQLGYTRQIKGREKVVLNAACYLDVVWREFMKTLNSMSQKKVECSIPHILALPMPRKRLVRFISLTNSSIFLKKPVEN